MKGGTKMAILRQWPAVVLVTSICTTSFAIADPIGNGKPNEPYTPRLVTVNCNGAGTKLQDALDGLNPVANVYDVRVTGYCPEPLSIRGFSQLTIRSSDVANRATIGMITFGGILGDPNVGTANGTVWLRDLIISMTNNGIGSPAIQVQQGNNIELQNILVSCDDPLGCNPNVIASFSSRVRIINLNGINGFENSVAMSFNRDSAAIIVLSADVNTGICSGIQMLTANRGSTVQLNAASDCLVGRLRALAGSEMLAVLEGQNPFVSAHSSLVQITSEGLWTEQVDCTGNAEVSTYPIGFTNYCNPF